MRACEPKTPQNSDGCLPVQEPPNRGRLRRALAFVHTNQDDATLQNATGHGLLGSPGPPSRFLSKGPAAHASLGEGIGCCNCPKACQNRIRSWDRLPGHSACRRPQNSGASRGAWVNLASQQNHLRVFFEVRARFAVAVDACPAGSQACAFVPGRLGLGVLGG